MLGMLDHCASTPATRHYSNLRGQLRWLPWRSDLLFELAWRQRGRLLVRLTWVAHANT